MQFSSRNWDKIIRGKEIQQQFLSALQEATQGWSFLQNVISWSLENHVYNTRTSGSDKQDADSTEHRAWN